MCEDICKCKLRKQQNRFIFKSCVLFFWQGSLDCLDDKYILSHLRERFENNQIYVSVAYCFLFVNNECVVFADKSIKMNYCLVLFFSYSKTYASDVLIAINPYDRSPDLHKPKQSSHVHDIGEYWIQESYIIASHCESYTIFYSCNIIIFIYSEQSVDEFENFGEVAVHFVDWFNGFGQKRERESNHRVFIAIES